MGGAKKAPPPPMGLGLKPMYSLVNGENEQFL